jgi:NADH:ubiquinone oxidoreductase subunit 6 (subunit J)
LQNQTGLISASTQILGRNKRYILWFYLLNVAFAWAGASAFSRSAHRILDHSLYADRLLHGFDLSVLKEMIVRPEFGPLGSAERPALMFALLFSLASLLLMPGVLLGFSSDHAISRDEFFRTCGRNAWRFVRVCVVFALIAGIVAGILFCIQGAVGKALDKSSNDDRMADLVQLGGVAFVYLVLTVIRIWFDLVETDVVLRDQPAVRKSVRWAFRTTRRNFFRLFGAYVLATIVAALILLMGIILWHALVTPGSVLGAFLVSQAILVLLLSSRFWQRAIAVAFYLRTSTERETELSSALHLSAISAP